MSVYNKVVWSEGLFLQPQHFQQQDRYVERYVETRCQSLIATQLGLHRDRDRTRFSEHRQVRADASRRACSPTAPRFGCRTTIRCRRRSTSAQTSAISCCTWRCRCAVPASSRSTVRRRPTDSCATMSASCRRAMPPSGGGNTALARSGGAAHAAPARERRHAGLRLRCRSRTWSNVAPTSRSCSTSVSFRPCCMRARRPGSRRSRPSCSGCCISAAKRLSGRVMATGRGAAAEFADFLMLQAINRYEPLLRALRRFRRGASRGSLSTLRARPRGSWRPSPRRRSGRRSFPAIGTIGCANRSSPVIASLRASLSVVLEQSAISIPLESKKFGISVAIVTDRSLYGTAVFILAARADLPSEELRRRFPAQLKIGPVEKIRDLVTLQLPGVPVRAGSGRAAADSVSRRVRVLRARSNQRAVGTAQDVRRAWPCTSPASSRAWRWNSGRFAADSGLADAG